VASRSRSLANKYEPLEKYLLTADPDVVEITLSFSELRKILGCELPSAAVNHRAWWGNQKETINRPQAHAWSSAGFEVDSVLQDPGRGWVRFRRKRRVAPQSSRAFDDESSRKPEPLHVASIDCTDRYPSVSGSNVYLVSCVKEKRDTPSLVRDLYFSDWFLKARAYVERTGMPWFILSAEYGLVAPDRIIAPYDKTLKTLPLAERRAWAKMVTAQMESGLPKLDRVIVFAGFSYREFLMDYLRKRFQEAKIPLEGLGIGYQKSWFARN
jgi:hypothetical protein